MPDLSGQVRKPEEYLLGGKPLGLVLIREVERCVCDEEVGVVREGRVAGEDDAVGELGSYGGKGGADFTSPAVAHVDDFFGHRDLCYVPCSGEGGETCEDCEFHESLDLGVGVRDGGGFDAQAIPGQGTVSSSSGAVDVGVLRIFRFGREVEVPIASVEAETVRQNMQSRGFRSRLGWRTVLCADVEDFCQSAEIDVRSRWCSNGDLVRECCRSVLIWYLREGRYDHCGIVH